MTDFKQKCDIDIIECWGNRGGPVFCLFTPRPSGCYLHQSHICNPLSRSTSFKAALFNKVTTGHRWPRGTWNVPGPNKCEIHTIFQRQEMRVWSPGQEDCLEKEMATHSSILAWEMPWKCHWPCPRSKTPKSFLSMHCSFSNSFPFSRWGAWGI